MKKLRKFFTVSVMFVTVLSMSVVAAPDAGAAASAGDLIKMDGLSAVYYLAADGKRYVFPTEATYYSWYSDFSSVVTIPQSELEDYPPGANVTMRPGTKLIQEVSMETPWTVVSSKVYAVEPDGKLLQIADATTAETLYGSDWESRIIGVPTSFITNYDDTGNQLDGTAYPTGSLIKSADAADTYYIDADGNARKITTEAAFTANRFSWDNVLTSTLAIPTAGTDITGAEDALTDTSSGAGGEISVGGSGITIALASDNPAATSIISDSTSNEYPQALIPFTKVNFTAAADGDVKVKTVVFTRTGIASDSDLGSMYLYDGDTRLAEYSSFSSKVLTFSNSSGLFTVDAGTTKAITLKGDLARGSTSVASGKTIGFKLDASSDVTTDGATVSGTFPISGNNMSTAQVSDLGHLYFAGASGSNGTYPSSVKADEANKSLWSVNITADSQDIQIDRIKYSMVGTIANDDIQNIGLYLAGTQVADDMNMDGGILDYDLSADPLVITSGQTKALELIGDMQGGSGRVFKFTIQKSSDVSVLDQNYEVYVTPNVNNTTTAFGVVQGTTGNGTTVSSGTITVGVSSDSPTGNVPDGGTAVTLAKFDFSATGEAVKIDNVVASSTCTGLNEVLVNFKTLLDGSQVGATDASHTCDGGTDSTTFSFGNTVIIPAGTTKVLSLVADLTNANIAAADTITVALQAGSGNATGQTTLTSLSTTAQTARTLTAQSGTATVVENTSFADRSSTIPTGTVSAPDVQIASFIITAGAGEGINVSQIVLKDQNGTTQMGDNFQNLKLKHEGTQIGSTVASLDTSGTQATYTFTPATSISIAKGQQYIVDVFADVKSSVADSATNLTVVLIFDSLTATGQVTGSSANQTGDVDLQQAYISAQGNLTITKDTDSPLAQQMVLGDTDQEIAKFKLAADAAEDINITKIVLNDILANVGTGTLKNIKLFIDGSQIGQTANMTTAYATSTYAAFDGLSLDITKNKNKVLTVKADLAIFDDVSANSPSGSTHQIGFLRTYDGTNEPITGTGGSSGQSITGGFLDIGAATDKDILGNTMTAYKAKITVAFAGDTPSGTTSGSDDQVVAKITISNATNDAGSNTYNATIQTLNFSISRTGLSNTADRELKVYKDSVATGNLLVTTSWLASGNQNFGDSAITDAGFTDVEIAPGTSKTFIVTMDTQDAANTNKLSIGMAATDVTWGDSTSTGVTSVNSLPLTAKTLSY